MKNLCPDHAQYYSQLNNEVNPHNICQCESMAAGLDLVFRDLSPLLAAAHYQQPGDCLYHYICEDNEIQGFCRRSHPRSIIPAPEWADVLCFAVNRLYGRDMVYFDGYITPVKITSDIDNGLPVMVSMRYLENRNYAGLLAPVPGHYILVVGYDEEKLIVNDPYKNHLTGDKDGFNNVYMPEDWKRHSKEYGIRYKRAA